MNECFEGSTLHNCINARCRNTNGGFECDCLPGYAKPSSRGNTCEGIAMRYHSYVVGDLMNEIIMQILMSVYRHPVIMQPVATMKGAILASVSHHSSTLTTQINAYVSQMPLKCVYLYYIL